MGSYLSRGARPHPQAKRHGPMCTNLYTSRVAWLGASWNSQVGRAGSPRVWEDRPGSSRLGPGRPSSARVGSAQLGSYLTRGARPAPQAKGECPMCTNLYTSRLAWLGASWDSQVGRAGSPRIAEDRPGLSRLGPGRPGSARLGLARLGSYLTRGARPAPQAKRECPMCTNLYLSLIHI